ncbi:MAG: DUF86 domain-containing protein [Bacteroides sp.]|nr:DUF86 domain-containing protein [Fermentimonas sp.]MDD4055750.1 DUF86 domain-containing protein [Bacteroides sp.]
MRDYHLYIDDIRESARKILRYTENLTYDEFVNNEQVVDAVVRNFEIIGEAAARVSKEIQQQYSCVPWKAMRGIRNILIHEYWGVDTDIIWKTIQESLPQLIKVLEEIKN